MPADDLAGPAAPGIAGSASPAGVDRLGLGAAERAAYELVLDCPGGTLAELAAGWNRSEPLAEVLAAVEERGLVGTAGDGAAGAVVRYAAVAPGVAFHGLLLDYEEQLDAARQRLAVLDAAYRRGRTHRDASALVEVVTGQAAVDRRLARVWREVRRELRCLDKHPRPDIGAAPHPADLVRPGLACRTIYDRPSLHQPGSLATVEELVRAGQQARVLPRLPMRLYLADDRLAVVPLPDGAALLVHPSALLDALGKLFDGLWQRALALYPSGDRPPAGRRTSDGKHQLVSFLLSGLTDEAIARQLGLSYRTVQRRVADLMAELGAHSRFQAGAQAALRGYPAGRTDERPSGGPELTTGVDAAGW